MAAISNDFDTRWCSSAQTVFVQQIEVDEPFYFIAHFWNLTNCHCKSGNLQDITQSQG